MPEGKEVHDGILKGLYRFKATQKKDAKLRAQLFGSGTIMFEVLKAQQILEEKYGVGADVWSVTSYKQLYATETTANAGTCFILGNPQSPLPHPDAEGCTGRVCGRVRLHEGVTGKHRAMGTGASGFSGHRRLRTQREPRRAARLL